MSFPSGLVRVPHVFDPDKASEVREALSDLDPALAELAAAAASASPYLLNLVGKEEAFLRRLDTGSANDLRDRILLDVANLDSCGLEDGLRVLKRRVALLTALADLGGVWALEDVTGALTRFADAAVARALEISTEREAGKRRTPESVRAEPHVLRTLFVVAMGKMGAFELNYSSDIDLICLFDPAGFDADLVGEARQTFVRVTRGVGAILSDITEEGYVFRTDFRLRPDASVTPVAMPAEAAERYYESVGRTWERAAYIKARPAAGDIAAGERFLHRLTPFVWRRHLDFAAIQDAHDMRLRIREHKGFVGKPVLEGHNVKLGAGGIREIEFYTQTRQIIAGGRDPSLRDRGTVDALAKLANAGWTDDADVLIKDYRALREVEHRLQMLADQQTHVLPTTEDGFARLAAFSAKSVADFRHDLTERLARVRDITEGFFAPKDSGAAPAGLEERFADTLSRWPSYPALRSDRAVRIFRRVRPNLLAKIGATARPDEAMRHFDTFLAGLPAGVQLFSLFEANPQLVDLIVDISATAPRLATYLSRNSSVFDAVIGGGFFSPWPGADALTAELAARLAAVADYEAKLDEARRWSRDWQFRTGVHHLRGLIDAAEAGKEYADVASAVCAALWDPVVAEFAEKHGPPPGDGAAVLGMGSLGSERMAARSDLDLIIVYDAEPTAMSEGRRPLMSGVYYGRLTQAYITALTAPTAEGKLFDVDMRLRPSGKQGPVATSFAAFRAYQVEKAWTWEHMALTRARVVAGAAELGERIEAFRREFLATAQAGETVWPALAEMRARLADQGRAAEGIAAKGGPGRLGDIAMFAQAAVLVAGRPERRVQRQLAAAGAVTGLKDAEIEVLKSTDRLFWSVQAASQLVSDSGPDEAELGAGAGSFLLRETGQEDIGRLHDALDHAAAAAAALIERHLPKEA